MARFKLSIEVALVADKAINEGAKIEKKMQGIGKESSRVTAAGRISWMKLAMAMAGVGAIAGRLFSSMLTNSPRLRVEMAKLGITMYRLVRPYGNQVAEVFRDYINPALRDFEKLVRKIPDDIQKVIGIFITLTTFTFSTMLGIKVLTKAVGLAGMSKGLIFRFLFLILVIALVIVAFEKLKEEIDTGLIIAIGLLILKLGGPGLLGAFAAVVIGMDEFGAKVGDTELIILALAAAIGFMIGGVPGAIIALVIVGSLITAWQKWGDKINISFDAINNLRNKLKELLDTFKDVIGYIEAAGNVMGDVWDWATGNDQEENPEIPEDHSKLEQERRDEMERRRVAETPGATPGLQEGGQIQRTGAYFLHKNERVLSGTQNREYSRGRGGDGGGNTFVFNITNPPSDTHKFASMQRRLKQQFNREYLKKGIGN